MNMMTRDAISFVAGLFLTTMIVGCSSAPPSSDDVPEGVEESPADVEAEPASSLPDTDLIPVGDSPMIGNPNAPVTVVVFSSLDCPLCGTVNEIFNELAAQNPDALRVVFKHLPLSDIAREASIVAEAAHRQDRFWEMKDILFERIRHFIREPTDQTIKEIGTDLASHFNMNIDQFHDDFDDPELGTRVDNDYALGMELGLTSTPTIFFNGEEFSGNYNIQGFTEFMEEKLAEAEEL